MIKIGILTHYHDTVNYGGALQAYALCKIIESFDCDCEQIDVDCFAECRNLDYKPSAIKRILKPFLPTLKKIRRMKRHRELKAQSELRKTWRKSFENFTLNCIPHTKQQYFSQNIAEIVTEYDAFVVGSDQVWNPIWYFEPFFLTFAPDSVPKIAYAASISQSCLSEKVKQKYSDHLKGFLAISVREENAVSLLSDIAPNTVEYVLDPTLLLTKEQWDDITSERIIHQPYVLCYFLGNDSNMRAVAQDFARKRGMILVNIPHATALYHTADANFGDIKQEAPSPNDFLSLIKNAEYIFTDSFHAMVFSVVFEKQFFVFERQNYASMSTRTESFMKLLRASERFCNSEEGSILSYIESLPDIDYSDSFENLAQMKEKSLEFLQNSLNTAKLIVKK